MRGRRILLVTLVLLVVVAGAVVLAARSYLSSDGARRAVAARLEAIAGMPVEVDAADIAVTGDSRLRGLRLLEAGAAAGATPWATVEEVRADLSAWDVLRGDAVPREVTLAGAVVTLRFDRTGKLLTRLPETKADSGALPVLHIERGQVTLHQEGRPEMVVRGVTADLRPEEGRLRLTGSVSDDYWGDWSAEGGADPAAKAFFATLKTPRADVTEEKLRRLPFVPAKVWDEVKTSGPTPVEFTYRHEAGATADRYRVVLEPDGAALDVTAIALHVEAVRGRVVVEDDVVRLTGLHGQALGGTLRTDGVLDFRAKEDRLEFDVKAEGLALRDLPREWEIPEGLKNLGGRLTGKAKLVVLVDDGKARTAGDGDARITGAVLAGKEADIRLRLHPTGRGFRFNQAPATSLPSPLRGEGLGVRGEPAGDSTPHPQPLSPKGRGGQALAVALVTLTLPAQADDANPLYARDLLRLTQQGVERVTQALIGAGRKAMEFLPRKGSPDPNKAPGYLDVSLGLQDADIEQLVQGIGVKVPFAVSGRLTFQVKASLPVDTPRDLKTYRVTGTASSPSLVVAGVEFKQLSVRARYADGVLTLTEAKASLYGGSVSGGGELPLPFDKGGRANLRFTDLDVGALARDVPAVPFRLEGRAGGKVDATLTPAAKGRGVDVRADVDLSAPKLRVQNFTTERLTGTVTYRDGAGEYHLKGGVFGGTFSLDGPIPPRREAPKGGGGRANHLRIERAQLGRVWEALGVREAPRSLRGSVDLRLDFDVGADGRPVGSGSVVVNRVRWETTELAESVRADLQLTGTELRFRDISGTLGEGALRGQVAINLRQFERSFFNLALDRVDVGRLLVPWPWLTGVVQGTADARLRGTLGSEWRGGGDVVLTHGRVLGADVAEWRLPISFAFAPGQARGHVDISETSAQVARGRVSGRASLGFGYGTRLEGHLRFYGVDLHTLLRQSLELSQAGSGQVSGRADFGGSDVRSFDDVTATVDASFSQTQALQLPILSQVAPYVAPGQSNATFQSGELRGRLANGLFRVQRLALSGTSVNLFGEGTVSREGRLNLNVTATTGRLGINPSVLRVFGLRLPPIGPVPVLLILQVTDYLSNRTVNLHVTGTVRAPAVRVEPVSLLTDEVVRFFLNRYSVPVP